MPWRSISPAIERSSLSAKLAATLASSLHSSASTADRRSGSTPGPQLLQQGPEPPGHLDRVGAVLADLGHPQVEVLLEVAQWDDEPEPAVGVAPLAVPCALPRPITSRRSSM
jgi:hypothetical protein